MPRPPPPPKSDLRAQAEAALAAFRETGKSVKTLPPAEAAIVSCRECGFTGTVTAKVGVKTRCPKCRTLLS